MGLLNNAPQEYYEGDDFGNYQFVSLEDIINQFMIVYVGEDKIISKASKTDVAFHAQRGLAELSFDTLKSCKAQEITVPASLQMTLPQDYVNYTKISWVDSAGIKHLLYPTSKTSNPQSPQIDANGDFLFAENGSLIDSGNLIVNGNFHGGSEGWLLNQAAKDALPQTIIELPGTTLQPFTDQSGWFWDNNRIIGYNLKKFQAIRQENVPIYSGEKYKITYTISGYSEGAVLFGIVNEDGHFTHTTSRSANGTYEETITSGLSTSLTTLYPAQSVYFQNATSSETSLTIDNVSIVRVGNEETSNTWSNYKSATPSENQDDYQDDTYWKMNGNRYGLDPQHAQANGSFYIDCMSGKIHFSSNISGKTVILDYISDSLGTDEEMQVHKFAEEAMYRWILHAIASGRIQTQQIVPRLKKEKFAAIRTAKLRLSNLKLEELTQILRGKSKQIKH